MEKFVSSRNTAKILIFAKGTRTWGHSYHGSLENVPSYTITSSNPDEPTTRFAPHTSRFVDFYKFANDGLYEENMTIFDEAIIPLSPMNGYTIVLRMM